MTIDSSRRIYDASTRLNAYVDSVKGTIAADFRETIVKSGEEIEKLLLKSKYKNLSELSKSELLKLIVALRKTQSSIYQLYTEKLLKTLYSFMFTDLIVNKIVLASLFKNTAEPLSEREANEVIKNEHQFSPLFGLAAIVGNEDKLWTEIKNLPIGANGLYLLTFIKTFANSAQNSVENIIRKAWIEKLSIEETLNLIIGEEGVKQGSSSALRKIVVQNSAVIDTAIAHIHGYTSAAVVSSLYGFYVWLSVIDNVTTEICRSRNLKIYAIGKGPLPPAHIRCRSHIAPINGMNGDIFAETFYTWLGLQPEEVQEDLLSESNFKKLKKGELKAKDISRFESSKNLTFEQFRAKVKKILL